ncbi:MAG: Acetyl-CoA synthetase, partial [uncultured Solirubrobacteraceae bacterium]
ECGERSAERPGARIRPGEPAPRGAPVRAAPRARRERERRGGRLRAGRRRPGGVLGRAGRPDHVGRAVHRGPRLVRGALRQVVRRRSAQRGVQLRRPARRGRQRRPGRVPLGRRARGPQPDDHLRRPPARGLQGRQRTDRARGRQRGPRGDLHADDPRDRRRDARLRPARRSPHRRLRRLLRRRTGQPSRGLRGQGRHHLRRWLPPWRAVGAQAGRRRGLREGGRGSGRHRPGRTPDGTGRRLARGPRRVVARGGRPAGRDPRAGGVRRRAPALRHVHLGHDRQAQGDPPHHRRLPRRHGRHALVGLRPQAGDRRLLVHRGRGLGDRPLLHGLRPAGQRRDAGDVRGDARHPAQGPLVGDHPGVRRHDLLHRPDGDPDLHEVGCRHPGAVRPLLAPAAGVGRGVDQPRGLHLVPRDHRRRSLSGRRHLVADRDRSDHDQPAAGGDR